MNLTPQQRKALKILQEHGPLTPRRFAKLMWPDSPGWDVMTNCGQYGVTRGGCMNLSAGAYLGKLRKKGLVQTPAKPHSQNVFTITPLGRQELKANEENNAAKPQ